MAEADELLIRHRPALAAGKYERMSGDLYAFYRGTVPLYRRDVADPSMVVARTTAPAGAMPLSLGDAHPENFGTLQAADGTFALEPNDFDGADRFPYHWDLRRLTVGLVLAARLSNPDDADARAATAAEAPSIVQAAVGSYLNTIGARALGVAGGRVEDDPILSSLIRDAFRRSVRDLETRDELAELTELTAEGRRFRRGVLDPDEPTSALLEVPAVVRDALPETLDEYRRSLLIAVPAEFFTVVDVVRQLGSGVASWPRVRMLVLVRGVSDAPDDDVILEVKELAPSGRTDAPPGSWLGDDLPERIRRTTRAAWARPDGEPFWSGAFLLGIPVQIRLEAERHKTLRVDRMEEDEGTPDDLRATATSLAGILARVHTTSLDGEDVARELATSMPVGLGPARDAFVIDEVARALAYADQVEADWVLFQQLVAREGPGLGLVPLGDDGGRRVEVGLRALFEGDE